MSDWNRFNDQFRETAAERNERLRKARSAPATEHDPRERTINEIERLKLDRAEQDKALCDAMRETAATADELAFWRYQAIYHRCLVLDPKAIRRISIEDHPIWREAERQLEEARAEENRERVAHAEAPRDPGAT